MSILVVTEHDNSALRPVTLSVVAAAVEIGGEIDLLAWQGEVLVIVEVKYRTTKSRWPLDLRQSQRLRRAALWIAANRQLVGGVRIDLIEVNPGRIPFFPLLDHLEAAVVADFPG